MYRTKPSAWTIVAAAAAWSIAGFAQDVPKQPQTPTTPPPATPPTAPAPAGGAFQFDSEAANKLTLTGSKLGGQTQLTLYFNGKPAELPTSVDLSVSSLSDTTFLVSIAPAIARGLCTAAKPESFSTRLTIAPARQAEPICLSFPPLPAPDAKYIGNFLLQSDKGYFAIKSITLSASTPPIAVLVAAPSQTDVIDAFVPALASFAGSQGHTAVTLSEKSGKLPIEGFSIQVDSTPKSPGGFSAANVRVSVDGADAVDLKKFNADTANRTIHPGERRTVDLQFNGLQPGDYSVIFAFGAANLAPDGTQKVNVTIHAKHRVYWALLVILLAMLISFLTTKVVVARRRSLSLQSNMRGLRPPWLALFAQTPPVVWMSAMLDQSEKLSSRFWLTSPDVIEGRVNSVRIMLGILSEARRMRDRLRDALDFMVFRWIVMSLERVVGRIDTGGLNDANVISTIHSDIAAFEKWLSRDNFAAVFWAELEPSVRRLQTDIGTSEMDDPAKALFAELIEALRNAIATPPTNATAAVTLYHQYARLRVLWSLRGPEDADTLAKCVAAAADLNKFFALADRRDWENLKKEKDTIRLVPPKSSGFEAFDPLQFAVTSHAISDTYLFHHKVLYRWQFLFTPKSRGEKLKLTPETMGPYVTQYFPQAGSVKTSVTLEYEGETVSVDFPDEIPIRDSSDFRIRNGFEKVEWLSWGIAAALAIVSAILMFYVKNPGFGSFQDYVTLFLWGAGVDQTKNFAQSLTATSTPPQP
jgi:hypothetical protein